MRHRRGQVEGRGGEPGVAEDAVQLPAEVGIEACCAERRLQQAVDARVERHARGRGRARDDELLEGDDAAGLHRGGHLRQRRRRPPQVHEHAAADGRVEAARQDAGLEVGVREAHVAQAGPRRAAARAGDRCMAAVDAEHLALRADHGRGRERGVARPAAHVEHAHARLDAGAAQQLDGQRTVRARLGQEPRQGMPSGTGAAGRLHGLRHGSSDLLTPSLASANCDLIRLRAGIGLRGRRRACRILRACPYATASARGDVLVVPGAFDALTARLLERAGFEALYRGGYAAAAAAHGLPDLGITTLTENADHLRRVAAAVSIPVIADADTGYGDVAQLVRTVQEYEHAGAAGVQFEDQVFPKRCGHMEGKQVIPAEEMEGQAAGRRSTRAATPRRSSSPAPTRSRSPAAATPSSARGGTPRSAPT